MPPDPVHATWRVCPTGGKQHRPGRSRRLPTGQDTLQSPDLHPERVKNQEVDAWPHCEALTIHDKGGQTWPKPPYRHVPTRKRVVASFGDFPWALVWSPATVNRDRPTEPAEDFQVRKGVSAPAAVSWTPHSMGSGGDAVVTLTKPHGEGHVARNPSTSTPRPAV